LTAALVVSLWVSEQISDWFSRPWRADILSLHITLGGALLVVLALRIFWRLTGGRSLPDAGEGVMELLARGTHYLLYAGVIATLSLGLVLEGVRADAIWGLFQLPSFAPGDKALIRAIRDYHSLAANFVLIVAGLHAAAALFHHYVLRDGVLRRTLPSA
jgi:cytochrome b561